MKELVAVSRMERLPTRAIKYLLSFGSPTNILGVTIFVSGVYAFIKQSRQYSSSESFGDGGSGGKNNHNSNPPPAVNRIFLKRLQMLLRVCVPSMTCRETIQLITLTALLLSRTYLTISIAEVMGNNAKSLVDGNFKTFIRGVAKLGFIAVPASMVNSGLKYYTNMLALNFRERLTKLAHEKYLQNNAFYRASNLNSKIDNCDQRISQDIDKFCISVSDLYSSTFKPLVDVVLFTRKLINTVGPNGPLLMFLYYILSGVILRSVMPSFARLISQQQKVEGDFRFTHNRLITHAEEIAFYGGHQRERVIINDRFNIIYQHTRGIFQRQAFVNVFDGWLVKYGASMAGYAVVALPVFGALSLSPQNANISASDRTRDYIRNTQILINLAKAIGQLVLLYKRLMSLAGYTSRVSELFELFDRINSETDRKQIHPFVDNSLFEKQLGSPPIPPTFLRGDLIRFEKASIIAPDGQVLVRDLTFEVKPGSNLLIAGPNGSGKSSLFRVLSELWPLQCGRVTKPAIQEIFYIPQRPYLAVGSLRDQIIYPHSEADMRSKGVNDAQLDELLGSVNLLYLKSRPGGWNAVEDWADTLSGGEKQRVAMARVFYHRPK